MPNAATPLHLYQRTVHSNQIDSLSIIAALTEPGQTVLDLGMGTGGLGKFLSQSREIVADGVSHNAAEAEIASAWYRHVFVADLDHASLSTLLGDHRYDCIICADVLEHLKNPQDLLAQCKELLKPEGRLITSVPNASYCGLVAELVQGDFRYRPEGLLDSTHLRFYTRKSLQRFFDDAGWASLSTSTIDRSLLESEFNIPFDGLPPAVSRYLLSLPDALTYQYITVLQPLSTDAIATTASDPKHKEQPNSADAGFSSQLYLATGAKYSEATKLNCAGRIGNPHQTLLFDIPASPEPYTHIRLDPADRPGFFRLHYLKILHPDGQLIWQWLAGQDSLTTLTNAPQQELLVAPAWDMSAGALLLLHGDDPWMELPLADDLKKEIAQHGAKLEVSAGWPMSADYLQARLEIDAVSSQHLADSESKNKTIESLREQIHAANNRERMLRAEHDTLTHSVHEEQLHQQRLENELQLTQQAFQEEKILLINELRATQHERGDIRSHLNQTISHLQKIENSTLFRVTRPLVHMKMQVDSFLGRSPASDRLVQPSPKPQEVSPSTYPVDIIVPVYRGLDDTKCCIESVLAANCQTNWRLIIINDCSPEPEVTNWLRTVAQLDSRIELLENADNLGFVGTVNRGMALSGDNDVLLLNSDAEVANDWLDRIQKAAYSAPRVASVTPFSNNATICSYPHFCKGNEIPVGYDTTSLDRLFATHLMGQTVQVPTGVGFCMYIRRESLRELGLFDEVNFGKGYGEENDFCIRAAQAGWTNLHALDTFVRHAGGISFGESKNARELQAIETLRRLHPHYERDVHAYVQRDPARSGRLAIDIARIITSNRPVILNVVHDREGGTLRHMKELAQQLGNQATFLRLAPTSGGASLSLEGQNEAFSLPFALPDEKPRLLQVLGQLQVGHIHYHHLLGHATDICDLPAQLGVTHDFTAHDFYSYCPQISLTDHTDQYCGETGIEQCRRCVHRSPAPLGENIDSWRDRHARLLNQARFVIAPSADAAARLHRFVPTARTVVVPHATLDQMAVKHPEPSVSQLPDTQSLKIVVLGALSKIKGADLLEEVATLAARQNIAVEFHLLGYAYRSLRTQPKARLTVHGGYEEKDLHKLIKWLKPDAIWFPAVWPETYSYTLSASLDSGLPIIAPNIGAFSERLQNRNWTWICDWDQTALRWIEFFRDIRQKNFATAIGPVPPATMAVTDHGSSMDYHGNYLQSLSTPHSSSADVLTILDQINQSIIISENSESIGKKLKSITLHIIVRLRASPVLSVFAKLLPLQNQRKIKSWLLK